MPFDRLVRTVDKWAESRNRQDVFAQIGPSEYQPGRIEWTRFLDSRSFRSRVEAADLLIAHAGMGSIITAMEAGTPILIMPRRGDLRETRNDHQIATAQRLRGRAGVDVAMDEQELESLLEKRLSGGSMSGNGIGQRISPYASQELIDTLRRFIFNEGGG